MTRDVEHVVHAAQNPEVAVFIALRAITGEVRVLPPAPVDLAVAFVVAPDGAEHPRPWLRDGEITSPNRHVLPLTIQQRRLDARKRNCSRPRFCGRHPRQRRDHDPARLRGDGHKTWGGYSSASGHRGGVV